MAVALFGVHGRPFVELSTLVSLPDLDAVHEEICLAFARLPTSYTGGSHRSMDIVPPSRSAEVHVDYGEVIAGLNDEQFARFRGLADDPSDYPEAAQQQSFGEERRFPLSRAQMLWLEARHGVYFPWQAFLELMPVARWEDKDQLQGKRFTREAETFLPRTLALLRSLPLTGIGRASLMGSRAFHHGTVHRDGDGARPAEFLLLCPQDDKGLFVWDEHEGVEHEVRGRLVWFNDADYHGVRAAPHFRYSLRVDGPFTEDFRDRLRRAFGAPTTR